jgi:hypothetical protein
MEEAKGRLLVAYDNGSNYVSTTAEYLDGFARHSRWDVRFLHVTHRAKIEFDLNEFDAILHNYCARLIYDDFVSADYLAALRRFRGVKLLSVQDEWDRTDRLRSAIPELGFHIVLCCLPERMVERVYLGDKAAQTDFIPVLPGYVPDHLEERGARSKPLKDRPIHIGYRGREIGARYGRLGFLKFEIGRRMREICEARGIPHDIEWSAEKRIYGEAWYEFIGSCRANLGTEGGSDVFDCDGSIEEIYDRLSAERGSPVPYEEFRRYTDPIEAQYDAGQLTPRLLEAAALKTPLILFPGKYSGLIEPEEHYIELKEDFSNVDRVLARLDDLAALEAMAERAHRRLVGRGEFSYRRFVGMIDDLLARKAAQLGVRLRPPLEKAVAGAPDLHPQALVSLVETPTILPRHPVFCAYKLIAAENALYREEIARLNEVYPAETARLNQIIVDLKRTMHGLGALADWRRRAAESAKFALVLKILLRDGLGRAALAEATLSRRPNIGLFVQLARVIAARKAPRGAIAGLAIVPLPSGTGFELVTATGSRPPGREALSPDDFVAALAARRVTRLTLVVDGAAGALFQRDRYELSDLLAWLFARPDRALRLGLAADGPLHMPVASFSAGAASPAVEAARDAS